VLSERRRLVTYEEQDSSAEEHEVLNGGLIERIIRWIRMLIVAMVTNPRSISGSARG